MSQGADRFDAVLGTLYLVKITSTSAFRTVNLTLHFWCYSLALNVIATALIIGRLVYHRYRFRSVLGDQHARQYTSIVAMLVESELLYTAYLVLYIVPFVVKNSLVNVFVHCPSVVQVSVVSQFQTFIPHFFLADVTLTVGFCAHDRLPCRRR